MRGAQTIWNGSAFDCPNRNNQITFIDNRILWLWSRRRGICTNATIEGRILFTNLNNYTSQLSITVTPDTARKTVVCLSDNRTTTIPIFSSVIPTIGLSPCINNHIRDYRRYQVFCRLLQIRMYCADLLKKFCSANQLFLNKTHTWLLTQVQMTKYAIP